MSWTIISVGDTREIITNLDSDSVQTIITSPPYYGLRDYGIAGQIGLEATPQEYVDHLVAVFRECHRVLKSDGTFWLNIGDSYAANRSYQVSQTKHQSHNFGKSNATKVPFGCKPKDLIGIPWLLAFALRDDGWYLRSDIIWHKPNALPESVRDRPTSSYEHIFLLTKSERYFYDAASVRENAQTKAIHKHWSDRDYDQSFLAHKQAHGVKGRPKGVAGYVSEGKRNQRNVWSVDEDEFAQFLAWKESNENLTNVWRVTTKPFKGAHFAVFPADLIEPCVKAGSSADGVVLDPFGGSGTTAMVANKLERNSILIEINPDYAKMAYNRLIDSGVKPDTIEAVGFT